MTEEARDDLLRWIKANAVVVSLLFGVLGAAGGTLWQMGLWVAGQSAQFGRVDLIEAALRKGVDNNQEATADIQKRLDEITASRMDARRQVEREINDLGNRVVILETQLKFVGDRVQQQGPHK